MNDDNNNHEDLNDADFEKAFFNGEPLEEDTVEEAELDEEVEEENTEEVDPLATDDDEDADEDEEEDVDPEPQQKQNKVQKRINELTAERRAAERELKALRAEFEAFKAGREEKQEPVKGLREQLPADAPNPDAVDEKGDPVYALGEFDKEYIRDLTKWTIEQETKAAKVEAEKAAQEQAFQQAQAELQANWIDKLAKAEETIPTIREDIGDLVEVFEGINEQYGEYLAATIMASDVGPELMHYFSNNIGEAQKIVASGPAAATIAIGRLEAQLTRTGQLENKSNSKKVSGAKEPPEMRTRGNGGQFAVRPDTDDQRAFEKEFFKR